VKTKPDAVFGAGWVLFGALVLAESWRMDRLASQNINPWSVPGLMPGVLGALMMLFGAALVLRALAAPAGAAGEAPIALGGRTWLALALCVGFAGGLLGRGLPFWLTAAAFLFVAIVAFRWLDRDAGAASGLPGVVLGSAVIAAVASAAISLLFQEVFLIRLP
jgi:hypothetical protein